MEVELWAKRGRTVTGIGATRNQLESAMVLAIIYALYLHLSPLGNGAEMSRTVGDHATAK